jgi:hypothetical protein
MQRCLLGYKEAKGAFAAAGSLDISTWNCAASDGVDSVGSNHQITLELGPVFKCDGGCCWVDLYHPTGGSEWDSLAVRISAHGCPFKLVM